MNKQTVLMIKVNSLFTKNWKFYANSMIQSYNNTLKHADGLERLQQLFSADMLGACAGFKASVGVAGYITAATGGTAGLAAGIAVLPSTGLIAGGASYGA